MGDFIAKGGGGQVYHCISRDSEITSRSQGQPLSIKIVCESETQLDQNLLKAFYQELAMMHFVKVFALSFLT